MMAIWLLLACGTPSPSTTDTAPRDEDGDGVVAELDCDDSEPRVSPLLLEVCDGRDNNCDGEVDEDPSDGLTWYVDADRDGWGDPLQPVMACAESYGLSAQAGDCDDANPDSNPEEEEVADNGVDDDCDSDVDEA